MTTESRHTTKDYMTEEWENIQDELPNSKQKA